MKLTGMLGLLLSFHLSYANEINFIPESSGICRLGNSLVIAGDEDSNLLWVWDDKEAHPRSVTVPNAKWDDVEDLTAFDQTHLFAVTSHSRTKAAKRKPEREQLMFLSKDQSNFAVQKKWSLREQILKTLDKNLGNDIDFSMLESAPADLGGLNIEGLAYQDGKLYLGLRSPKTKQGEAIVIVVDNVKQMLQGAAPEMNQVLRLSLGNRGIRGLASHTKGFLILSGSNTDVEMAFGLYDFQAADQSVKSFSVPNFGQLTRPEGIGLEKNGSIVLVQDFLSPQAQHYIVRLPFAADQ